MAERYSSVISEGGRFSLNQDNGQMHVIYLPGDRSFSRDQIDTVLLLLKKFGEWLYCRSVPPVRVMLNFTVADSEVDEYQRAYGCLPEFGADKNVLVLGDSIIDASYFGEAIGMSLETPTLKAEELIKFLLKFESRFINNISLI